MATLESVFVKEFKRNIHATQISKNIYEVPLPPETKQWGVSGTILYAVKGITDELYSGLNRTLVKKIPSDMKVAKRKVSIVTRDFVRDDKGNYIYEDVKIPTGSMAIVSEKNLNLPYKYKATEGFGYIDYVIKGGKKEYIYYIPKVYLYQTHQTALAISVKSMKNYIGMGYVSWKFGTIFLHIIPYKPNSNYVGSKILKTSVGLNYNREVKSIVDFWILNKVIPDIHLCDTDEHGNLAIKETVTGYIDYAPMEEISLGDKEIYGSSEQVGEDGDDY